MTTSRWPRGWRFLNTICSRCASSSCWLLVEPMKTKQKQRTSSPSPQKAPPEFWLWILGLVFAIFAVFQVYGPALHGPFLFDDLYLPMNVPAWANGSFLDSLRGVRPILMASYWVNNQLAATDTTQYHVWNVFFHFLNGLLVFFITRK